MKTQTIFLCGGAGYIGSVLLEKLLDTGYKVRLCDILYFGLTPIEHLLNNPRLKLIQKDINNVKPEDIKGSDIVINLAAISNDPSCDLDPNETTTTNYLGNSHLAQLAKENGIKKYIFMSSCSVYGDNDRENCTEKTKTNPLTVYAKSKVLSEQRLISLNSSDFNVVIFRSGTAFGTSRRMRFDLVINKMTLDGTRKNEIIVNGDGNQMRPFTHVIDISRAIINAIDNETYHKNPIFNLASISTSIKEISELVATKTNSKIQYIKGNIDARSYRVCTDKIVSILNYKPEVTLEKGIDGIVDWINTSIDDLYSNKYYTINYYKELFKK